MGDSEGNLQDASSTNSSLTSIDCAKHVLPHNRMSLDIPSSDKVLYMTYALATPARIVLVQLADVTVLKALETYSAPIRKMPQTASFFTRGILRAHIWTLSTNGSVCVCVCVRC